MARVLLLLPTSTYRAADFISAAAVLGADVVIGSNQRQPLAEAMGDRALELDFGNPHRAADAIQELHGRSPIDAIVAADDQGVVAAATASERLGLPQNPPSAAAITRNKHRMRTVLTAAGVPQPSFRAVRQWPDVTGVVRQVGFPCVVKPLSLSASRGVIRADGPQEAEAAAQRIWRMLREAGEECRGPLLLDGYIPGTEVAVEGLLRGGRLEVLAIFDKPDPLEGPYFEETIYVTPSRHPLRVQEQIRAATAEAAGAMGLKEGPVHAELRLNAGGAWVLEIAARSIGGLCSRSLQFGMGVSLEEVILRHALGLPLDDLRRQWAASGVMMLPIPRAGILREVRGREDALAVPGVAGLEITIAPGKPVRPLPEGDRYLGFLFANGETPEAVERALRKAHSKLEFAIA